MKRLLMLARACTDALLPPRKTERVVRLLTEVELRQIRTPRLAGDVEALLPYDDARVSALIWELKYYGSRQSVALLGDLLRTELPGICAEALAHTAILIPIPLHPKRQKARGFNQTERITRYVANDAALALEHVPEALMRSTDTPRQTALPRSRRLVNVSGAFTVPDPAVVTGKTCIVVDDVVTTGSTLKSAAETLQKAGARTVILIALAHAG